MKNKTLVKLAFLAVFGLLGGAVHAHDGHDLGNASARLGTVSFKTSCSGAAQHQFEYGLSLVHSFHYPESVKAFSEVVKIDPSCAIGYWGIAISQLPNPLVGPWDTATLQRGLDAVRAGESLGAATPRERDWIKALDPFFRDYQTVDQDTRTLRYERAMARLARKYPDDVEAQIFHALALIESFDHKSMAPLEQALDILEPLNQRYPDHPGITHYLIHAYDFPSFANRGLDAADKYARIAPAAPHALHMPSHIYSMLGVWNRSIASNVASAKAASDYSARSKMTGTPTPLLHAYDFMEYAYLQLGHFDLAGELVKTTEALATSPLVGAAPIGYMALAAIPARFYLERKDWGGAAGLVVNEFPFPPARAVTHFARAMGACRLSGPGSAMDDIRRLAEIRDVLSQDGQTFWADQVDIQRQAATAWCTFHAPSQSAEALKQMRAAADLEDSSQKDVAMENRLYPMRELYADMLLANGQAAAALREYQTSLKSSPNRLGGLYGAYRAAVQVGNAEEIVDAAKRLVALGKQSGTALPEFSEAQMVTSAL